MKRCLDIVLVLLAMPLWLPLFLWTALFTFLFMGSPIFFRQERNGFQGKPFSIVKFRTMKNFDIRGAGNGERGTGIGEQGTGCDDAARLTRFGRFLRATSLDELPELFLVLTGKMSLVGPRPLPTRYLPRYSEVQLRRFEAMPGITGWAQVHGRNSLSWEDKFSYDVWYAEHQSVWLDIKILFMTVGTVFSARGISAEGEATMKEFKGKDIQG